MVRRRQSGHSLNRHQLSADCRSAPHRICHPGQPFFLSVYLVDRLHWWCFIRANIDDWKRAFVVTHPRGVDVLAGSRLPYQAALGKHGCGAPSSVGCVVLSPSQPESAKMASTHCTDSRGTTGNSLHGGRRPYRSTREATPFRIPERNVMYVNACKGVYCVRYRVNGIR